jgi:uncharacterized membrane protein
MSHFLGNKYRDHEPVWHVQLAVLVAIVLQISLPDKYLLGSHYLLASAEFLLLIALSVTTPKEKVFESFGRRLSALLLIAITGLANGFALITVANKLLQSGQIANGRELILTAINIFVTNVIIFGLLYWEMDGGGPGRRAQTAKHDQDFMFPQDQNENYKHPRWRPTFADYVYLSSTNSMAFSPTDTMPLSRRAKLLMLGQATLSIVTVALVAARAVNILH